jgi:hypothetical protein
MASKTPTVARAVYDPTIREVIAEGDLDRMKKVLRQAKTILKAQGDLKSAAQRLEKAIAKRERQG